MKFSLKKAPKAKTETQRCVVEISTQFVVLCKMIGNKVDFCKVIPVDSRGARDTLLNAVRELNLADHEFTLILGENDYTISSREVPEGVSREDFRLSLVLQEEMQHDNKPGVVDIFPVMTPEISVNKDSRPTRVYSVYAEQRIIKAHMELFRAAGLNLVAIDIRETAQRNLVSLFGQDSGAVAMLSVFDQYAIITISYRGMLCFARKIEPGNGFQEDPLPIKACLEMGRSLDFFDSEFSSSNIPVEKLFYSAPIGESIEQELQYRTNMLPVRLDVSSVLDVSSESAFSHENVLLHRTVFALGACLAKRGEK